MIKFYNTLTRKKKVFKPRENKKVNLFVCGPTTYDFSHLGHARTYIVFDMMVKYLRQKGFKVFYLQNITDVDDKVINRAKEEKNSWQELSKKFEKEYLKDMKTLSIDSVNQYAPATKHIKEIISQVERLLEKGYAYQIEDGIYYDISKFKDYGKLSKRTALQAEDAVSRIDEAKEKRNKGDFCLWKLAPYRPALSEKSGAGAGFSEPSWSTPFGWGRPGWHIEDTAITEKFFGPQYDIHGGARDLTFPHHEAEIAQMEAISGKKPMVRYWVHTGFLTVNGQKMAKSLGNFITIQDFLKKYPGRLLRLLVVKTHYRSPIDYNEKLLSQTKKELERIDEFIEKLQKISDRANFVKLANRENIVKKMIFKIKKEFERAMEDDFNTPKAIASIFSLINKVNPLLDKNELSRNDAQELIDFLKKADEIFGFIFWKKPKIKIPEKILKLVKEREGFRKKKNFIKSDEIRRKIKDLGYQVEDTKDGPKIKPR